MKIVTFLPGSEISGINKYCLFLIRNERYFELPIYLASKLRYYTERNDELRDLLKNAELILFDLGDWDSAKDSISHFVEEFIFDLKIPNNMNLKGRPYILSWHVLEQYLRWCD